jgi:hypothetical protein
LSGRRGEPLRLRRRGMLARGAARTGRPTYTGSASTSAAARRRSGDVGDVTRRRPGFGPAAGGGIGSEPEPDFSFAGVATSLLLRGVAARRDAGWGLGLAGDSVGSGFGLAVGSIGAHGSPPALRLPATTVVASCSPRRRSDARRSGNTRCCGLLLRGARLPAGAKAVRDNGGGFLVGVVALRAPR